ncbi:unnamed protein product [Paramecium sonneborni]|uniref:Transmembrane protein n=1 Tax=Paramecium sonneborni TaxID=65129 RepID=A0A8S1LKD8_9CILI|nr:unnamed protein product [Paramecium sonneborni]
MIIIEMQQHIQVMRDQKNHGLFSFGLHGVKDVIEQLKFGRKWLLIIMVQQILELQIHIIKNLLVIGLVQLNIQPLYFLILIIRCISIMNLQTQVILLNFLMKRNIFIQNLMALLKKLITLKNGQEVYFHQKWFLYMWLLLTSLCIYGNKQEKKDKSEAKRVKLELYRKLLEQQEREQYFKIKRD